MSIRDLARQKQQAGESSLDKEWQCQEGFRQPGGGEERLPPEKICVDR